MQQGSFAHAEYLRTELSRITSYLRLKQKNDSLVTFELMYVRSQPGGTQNQTPEFISKAPPHLNRWKSRVLEPLRAAIGTQA